MKWPRVLAVLSVVVVLAAGSVGCGSGATGNGSAQPAGQATSDHDHAGHDHSAADLEKVKTALSTLPPEDAVSAEKQHVCPVSNAMLGSMGPPQKVDVQGTPVWICCEGCRDTLVADPGKYLAKLKKE